MRERSLAVEVVDPGAALSARLARRSRARRRLVRNWPLSIGLLVLAAITVVCLAAPLLTSYDPAFQDLLNPGAAPFTANHILGTDAPYGRDVLSRLLYGGRIDLLVGVAGTGVTLIVGTIVGMLAGYFGGWLDSVLMRIVDIFFAFPFFVLVLVIVAMLGPGLFNFFVAIWLVGWVSYARIIRGEVLVAKQQEYVLAARALGYNDVRIMARHILPNVIAAGLIFSMVDAVGNILLGAALGYLGLGVPAPQPEWGVMIADGQTYILTAWWVPTIPGLAIVLVGVSLSLVGDGLADILRPRE
jgi:peptide/nickel transport system permease protein